MSDEWRCKNPECRRTFPVPARLLMKLSANKKNPWDTESSTVEKACCPHCHSIDFEAVSIFQIKASFPLTQELIGLNAYNPLTMKEVTADEKALKVICLWFIDNFGEKEETTTE